MDPLHFEGGLHISHTAALQELVPSPNLWLLGGEENIPGPLLHAEAQAHGRQLLERGEGLNDGLDIGNPSRHCDALETRAHPFQQRVRGECLDVSAIQIGGRAQLSDRENAARWLARAEENDPHRALLSEARAALAPPLTAPTGPAASA